jgi:ribosomal protein L37AE/L43A
MNGYELIDPKYPSSGVWACGECGSIHAGATTKGD